MKKHKISINLILKIILSATFGLVSSLNSSLVCSHDIYATADDVFFLPFSVKNIIVFLVAFVIAFAVLMLLSFVQKKSAITFDKSARTPNRRDYTFLVMVFILLIIAWLPYLLSFFPGGVYPDTATSIGHARENTYNNQQPVFYALIFRMCMLFAGERHMVMMFSVIQCIFMAACFSYIIYRLRLHNLKKPFIIAIFLYFAFFNLIPLYVVSLWKDSLYSTVLLMFIFTFTEGIILSDGKPKTSDIIKITAFMVLSVFLRNNGIYVMILTSVIVFFVYGKRILSDLKSFFVTNLITLVICLVIQGPVFSGLGINAPFVENLGVMQQQIAYVNVIGGDMTHEEADFLSKICPPDTMYAYYRPYLVDTIKWNKQYDNGFLENNKGKFIKTWAKLFPQNPRLYMNAHLFVTTGFWNPYKQSVVSYVNPEMSSDLKDIDRYRQHDIVSCLFGKSIRNDLMPKHLISSAVFLFATLAAFVLTLNKKDRLFLAFLPALLTYFTVFLATPLAFALRYVYIVVLTLPLFILFAFIRGEK